MQIKSNFLPLITFFLFEPYYQVTPRCYALPLGAPLRALEALGLLLS